MDNPSKNSAVNSHSFDGPIIDRDRLRELMELRKSLTPAAVSFYLMAHMECDEATGVFTPRFKEWSELTGISVSSIRRGEESMLGFGKIIRWGAGYKIAGYEQERQKDRHKQDYFRIPNIFFAKLLKLGTHHREADVLLFGLQVIGQFQVKDPHVRYSKAKLMEYMGRNFHRVKKILRDVLGDLVTFELRVDGNYHFTCLVAYISEEQVQHRSEAGALANSMSKAFALGGSGNIKSPGRRSFNGCIRFLLDKGTHMKMSFNQIKFVADLFGVIMGTAAEEGKPILRPINYLRKSFDDFCREIPAYMVA